MRFSTIKHEMRICDGCGEEFASTDHRQRVCKKNCRRNSTANILQFVGVDGEGRGDNPSSYILFGIGDRHIESQDAHTSLSWEECFSFLYREFERRGKGCAFVGFFLGYDFAQILKGLPEDRARMLLTAEGRAKRAHRRKGREPHPVEYKGWQFDILGSKRLRIRPKNCKCNIASCKCPKAPWCFLCDVGGFWQTSFLNVINPKNWPDGTAPVTDEEYEIIRRGKERRSTAELDDDMRNYMHLEIRALEKAMSVLADGFGQLGLHLSPKQWFGPGQAAAQWMRGKLPKREELFEGIPDWYLDAARGSYYGGWFETFCHGVIKGETYEYDINSAYPSVIATLPCLLHGTFQRGHDMPPRSPHTLVKARVRIPGFHATSDHGSARGTARHIGVMLHRNDDGSICRPDVSEGWFWLEELEASIRAGCVDRRTIEYREWVSYEPCDCPPPFEGIAGLYQDRLRFGKNTPLGKACKLVYNSCYGKFAQSIGSPQYGNPIYASRITSGCRRIVLDAIGTHPMGQHAVAMVATDAVFFLQPHPGLRVSDRLGEWDTTVRRNLTIFKPGVYWDDSTREQIRKADEVRFKARGINAQKFAEELWKVDFWFQQWDPASNEDIQWPDVQFESGFSIITPTQALAWNKWHLAGRNNPRMVYHTSIPRNKRRGIWFDSGANVFRSGLIHREYNWQTGDYDNVCSTPYQKRFGLDDPFSDESREENGITPDGTVNDMFRWIFKNG